MDLRKSAILHIQPTSMQEDTVAPEAAYEGDAPWKLGGDVPLPGNFGRGTPPWKNYECKNREQGTVILALNFDLKIRI